MCYPYPIKNASRRAVRPTILLTFCLLWARKAGPLELPQNIRDARLVYMGASCCWHLQGMEHSSWWTSARPLSGLLDSLCINWPIMEEEYLLMIIQISDGLSLYIWLKFTRMKITLKSVHYFQFDIIIIYFCLLITDGWNKLQMQQAWIKNHIFYEIFTLLTFNNQCIVDS